MIDKSTRRDFLKRSAAVATGAMILPQIIPSTAMGMGGKLPPSDRIVMGAIGVGSQGTGNMRTFLEYAKEVQFVAVCDVDSKHADNAKKLVDGTNKNTDCRTYGDYREFLEKEKLDAVSIALPDHWHGLIYSAAANKKLDIYGEKPLARTIYDGRAIVSAVKKNNIVWQTGSWQRSGVNFRKAVELVVNGRIGKIIRVEVGLPDGGRGVGTPPVMEVPAELNWEMWLGPAPKVPFRGISHWNWRWILDYSGGQLTDWAGHHIDIAQWGLGMERSGPVEISGKGVYPREGLYNVPVEYDFNCKYANGIEMRVANMSRYYNRSGKGWDGREKNGAFGMGAVWYGDEGWLQVGRNGMFAENPKVLEIQIGANEIHLYNSLDHHQNFLDCVISKKETIAPAEVGHRSISVALLGEIAMTTGLKLKWDPQAERFTNSEEANRLLLKPMRTPWALPILK